MWVNRRQPLPGQLGEPTYARFLDRGELPLPLGRLWRQEREAWSVLINPAISNVDRDTERVGEIAGGAT